jgi:hypothetical protein
MRIAAVLAVAAAYGVFVDALAQRGHPMLRELGADENQSQLVPAKLLMANDAGAECSWGAGLQCELDALTNDLRLGTTCALPVPVPTDNYVGDQRRNKYDDGAGNVASEKPYVEITSSLAGTEQTTGKVTWAGYLLATTAHQRAITFATPGLYSLSIAATDYDHTATCDGCVAIRDTFRPQFDEGVCPAALVSPPTTLTSESLAVFHFNEEAYDAYVDDSNVVNNEGSGADCSTASAEWKTFGVEEAEDAEKCYGDSQHVVTVNQLKTSPLVGGLQSAADALEPLLNALSTWCCTKTKTIKEEYVEYSCPDTSPASTCVGGTGNTCDWDVCLKTTGNDIATAEVSIQGAVQTASVGVIAALPENSRPEDADASTKNVYYSIPCTDFDDDNADCHYSVKLSELLELETGFQEAFPLPASDTSGVDDFIFWRYTIDGSAWATWNPTSDSAISFKDASSTVTLEAWTAAGQVGTTYTFDVNLFVHSELICANFDDMWSGVGVDMDDGGAYCSLTGSDFTILNLDYDYTAVLPHSEGTVTGTYTGISCDIMVKETDEAAADTTVANFVSGSDEQLNKNIAVEMVHDPHTAQKTTGVISCTFTRTAHVNSVLLANDAVDPHSLTCTHTFHVTDCDTPELYIGDAADVCAANCAGKADPGLFEQCGGTVVSSTSTATVVSTTEKSCCADCSPDLECTAVGESDIERCEIPLAPLLLAQLAAAEQKVFASQTMMALLGASAMVAVVALVVVKRRAHERSTESDDAYYPLLE